MNLADATDIYLGVEPARRVYSGDVMIWERAVVVPPGAPLYGSAIYGIAVYGGTDTGGGPTYGTAIYGSSVYGGVTP